MIKLNLRFVAVCFVSFVAAPVVLIGCEQPTPTVNVQPTETVVVTVPCAEAGPALEAKQCNVDADCADGLRCNMDSRCVIPCHRDVDCANPALWCGEPAIKSDPAFASCQTNPDSGVPTDAGSEAAPAAQLKVSFDPSTFEGRTLYRDEKDIGMFSVLLDAVGADQPGYSLTLHHRGVGPMSDFTSAYAISVNELGEIVINLCDIDAAAGTVTCAKFNDTVFVGKHKRIELALDMVHGTPDAEHSFGLVSATDVVPRDPTTVVTGSFPLNAATFTVSHKSYKQLSVTYEDGPSGDQPCGKNITLLVCSLQTAEDTLDMERHHFHITSSDGGAVRGSNGSAYFSNFKTIRVVGGQTIQGPMGLPDGAPLDPTLTLWDLFTIFPEEQHLYSLTADIACEEDADGELIGHHYDVTLEPYGDGEVTDVTSGSPLEVGRINLSAPGIVSSTFKVTK